jgi:hypothetical protein
MIIKLRHFYLRENKKKKKKNKKKKKRKKVIAWLFVTVLRNIAFIYIKKNFIFKLFPKVYFCIF